MKLRPTFRRYGGAPAVGIALAGLVAVGLGTWWSRPVTPVLPVYGAVPDFSLIERSGRAVTRTDLLGHVSVVDFFYTRCTETCPLQSAYLSRLQADPSLASDALLVSITVDPEHDRPDVLAAYAAQFRADPRRWLFLTGSRADIYRLAVDGFGLAAFSARRWFGPEVAWAHDEIHPKIIRLVHASRFAVVDRAGRIRSYVDAMDSGAVDQLGRAVRRAIRERPVRGQSAAAGAPAR